MTTLYRAAKDDYLDQGYSFTESRETAELYMNNPGFGGGKIYTCEATGRVLDLTGVSMANAAAMLGCKDPCAIGVDEWLPRTVAALDAAREQGYSWVTVSESYPAGTTTWIWVGDSSDEPEITEA